MNTRLKDDGFDTSLKLSRIDLNIAREHIYQQWLRTVISYSDNEFNYLEEINYPITKYHLLKINYSHSNAFCKQNRMLSDSFCTWFAKTTFYQELKHNFGEFIVSDEERLGRPNFYWRITRPNEASDIGPLHRDAWFWELDRDYRFPYKDFKRIKVWIPLYVIPNQNGLLVSPRSHKEKNIKWETEFRNGMTKPKITNIPDYLSITLVKSENGNAIVFDDELLHGGAPNVGKDSRVSMEFTMIVNTKPHGI